MRKLDELRPSNGQNESMICSLMTHLKNIKKIDYYYNNSNKDVDFLIMDGNEMIRYTFTDKCLFRK